MSSEGKKTEVSDNRAKVEVEPIAEAIEEDDEFEEFEPCRWDTHDEDAEDAQQWQVSSIILRLMYSRLIFSFIFHSNIR